YKGIAANIADKPVETKVTDTGSRQISFVLEVPEDMRNQDSNIIRTFYVLRVHDGAADVLAQGTGDQISVSSSLFSTYVIAYHDEKVGQDDDDDEDDEDDDVAVSNAAGSAANQAGQTVYITSPKTGEETQAGMWMWVVLIGTAGILVCKGKMFLFTKSHSKK
ncbi:MAG: hypothetical protein IJ794_15070, partial [Lachnospiraceae bacterium]|nr:hypothetical protein [Lachnospiraceae bacterium]